MASCFSETGPCQYLSDLISYDFSPALAILTTPSMDGKYAPTSQDLNFLPCPKTTAL